METLRSYFLLKGGNVALAELAFPPATVTFALRKSAEPFSWEERMSTANTYFIPKSAIGRRNKNKKGSVVKFYYPGTTQRGD